MVKRGTENSKNLAVLQLNLEAAKNQLLDTQFNENDVKWDIKDLENKLDDLKDERKDLKDTNEKIYNGQQRIAIDDSIDALEDQIQSITISHQTTRIRANPIAAPTGRSKRRRSLNAYFILYKYFDASRANRFY